MSIDAVQSGAEELVQMLSKSAPRDLRGYWGITAIRHLMVGVLNRLSRDNAPVGCDLCCIPMGALIVAYIELVFYDVAHPTQAAWPLRLTSRFTVLSLVVQRHVSGACHAVQAQRGIVVLPRYPQLPG